MINLVGDHATYHKKYDAPLNSDVIGLARPVSHWVRSAKDAISLPTDALDAVQAANVKPGQIATLIVPADCAWNESGAAQGRRPISQMPRVGADAVATAARLLTNGKPTIILMSKLALSEKCVHLADQIAQATGARIYADTLNRKLSRGEGRSRIERLGYFAEQAMVQIQDAQQLIMVGTKAPVGFFAYPGKASEFYPEGSTLHTLAQFTEDPEHALQALADELGASKLAPRKITLARPGMVTGDLNPRSIGHAVAELLPAGAIVIDEGGTCGGPSFALTETSAPHDWLMITGGSIGYGLPAAIGAAVAGNGRKVLCLHGDGGAMYTIQSLWTMARENLDICTVILANRKYQILRIELERVGAQSMNKRALDMMDLSNPDLDFVKLAEGMGVKAARATTADEFNKLLAAAMQEKGPRLIEAMLD
jgi:acetolactate synthase-1/2/3 large subunit